MRTLKLKPNGVGRYDNTSPFIVTDNKLELKVELPNFNGEFYFVAENNGKSFKKLIPRGGSIFLDDLTAGEINAEVKHYLKGELIKPYKTEPLILREVDGSLSGTPEIIDLQAQITVLGNSLKEYANKTAERKKKLKEEIYTREAKLEKNLLALIRFAFKDYENNVYLDGGSLEKFISEFGFELNEEEINLLKGEKQNVDKN